jgi:hypothetical protein
MKNLIKILAVGLPLMASCAINNYPNINAEEFAIAKRVINKKTNFGIFLDMGEKGKLDDEDILLLNTEVGVRVYTLGGAWNDQKERVYSPWDEREKLMKYFSTEYFNNQKDFEQKQKEIRDKS